MNLRFVKTEPNETEEHFLWRIGQAYDHGRLDGNWKDICDVMNKTFRDDETEYYGESAYRKAYQQAKRFFDAGVFTERDADYLAELASAKHEIRKEKQKLFDERMALNKVLREEARRESMYDIVKHAIDEYRPIRFEYSPRFNLKDGEYALIIHCTDLHAGMDIDSPFNTYNLETLKQRLCNYLNEIKETKERYDATDAYVILGGDMIDGLIHLNARLEQKEGVVQQIMAVSDAISNFLFELSKMFKYVEVHTTVGNHARTHENKQHVRHGDNFDLLVPYVCKRDLSNVTNIQICDNYLDYDIATFKVCGHQIFAVHGEKDSSKAIVSHMIDFARQANIELPEMIFTAHNHANGYETIQGIKVVHTGCMCGMSQFTVDTRLTGNAEQTITVTSKKRLLKAICDVPVA